MTQHMLLKEQLMNIFAANLRRIMDQRGLNQSDVARLAFDDVYKPPGAKYVQVKGRDRISIYLRKGALPSRNTLLEIAKGLGVHPDELLPNYSDCRLSAQAAPAAPLSIAAMPHRPGYSHVVINLAVPTAVAMQLGSLAGPYSNTGV